MSACHGGDADQPQSTASAAASRMMWSAAGMPWATAHASRATTAVPVPLVVITSPEPGVQFMSYRLLYRAITAGQPMQTYAPIKQGQYWNSQARPEQPPITVQHSATMRLQQRPKNQALEPACLRVEWATVRPGQGQMVSRHSWVTEADTAQQPPHRRDTALLLLLLVLCTQSSATLVVQQQRCETPMCCSAAGP